MPAFWHDNGIGPLEDTLGQNMRSVKVGGRYDPKRDHWARSTPCVVEKIDGKWQAVRMQRQDTASPSLAPTASVSSERSLYKVGS